MTQDNLTYLTQLLISEKNEFNEMINSDHFSDDDKFHKLNSVITIKALLNYSGDDSIYLDFKLFMKFYIKAVEQNDSGYDKLLISRITEKLSIVNSEDRLNLIRYFKRLLSNNGYSNESKQCEEFSKQFEFEHLKGNLITFSDRIKLLLIWTSLNVYNLTLFFIIFYILTFLALLPAPIDCLKIFNFKQVNYSTSPLVNYSVNSLALLCNIDSTKAEATCVTGLLFIIIGKLLYIVVLINYLVKNLNRLLKLSE